jgi:hypothetical protein
VCKTLNGKFRCQNVKLQDIGNLKFKSSLYVQFKSSLYVQFSPSSAVKYISLSTTIKTDNLLGGGLNPLPLQFKSLLPGQEDRIFFSGHLNLHAKPETGIPYREKNYNN